MAIVIILHLNTKIAIAITITKKPVIDWNRLQLLFIITSCLNLTKMFSYVHILMEFVML